MKKATSGISTFQRFLSLWVLLCMAAGILIGKFLPAIPKFLGQLEIAGISIPIAILFLFMQRFYVEGMSGAVKG